MPGPIIMNNMPDNKTYSIIIPFYNEEETLSEIIGIVAEVMDGLNETYEIIAVNDGSTDGTHDKLEELKSQNKILLPIHFEANKGQMACLIEGFQKASGDIIISLDGDLQDDPGEIPSMIKAFEEKGCDVLCGWRKTREDKLSVKMLSRTGNFFQRFFLNIPIHDISCTFRIYKNDAAKSIKVNTRGYHRFIPFFIKKSGFILAERIVYQQPRKYGSSKYTFNKSIETIKLFIKILTGEY